LEWEERERHGRGVEKSSLYGAEQVEKEAANLSLSSLLNMAAVVGRFH
jgi:hypothetical protein